MGAHILSYHVKSADIDAVRETLHAEFQWCWMSPCEGGWISFYEGTAMEPGEIPKFISRELGCPVIGFCVVDSDFLCYVLCDKGWQIDEYNSWPDCYNDTDGSGMPGGDTERLKGRPDILLEHCPPGTNIEELASLLHDRAKEFAFAEHHLVELAKLMGINPERARTTYADVGAEFDAKELDLEFVGSEEPTESQFERWPGLRIASLDEDVDEIIENESPDAILDVGGIRAQLPPEGRLQMAVAFEEIAEVRRLLMAGTDPTGVGNLPLITAIGKGHQELIDLLLDHGPDLTAVDEDGGTSVLHHAACAGDAALVRRLIDLGCDVNAVADRGGTPLHSAIEFAAPDVVAILLESGAEPSIKDKQGKDALQFAEQQLELHRTARQRWEADGNRYPKEHELPDRERCLALLRGRGM